MRQLPPLDTRVRAAWQTQVAAAVNTPGLLPALVPGSPALDASPVDADCLPTDQRGVPRPQGSARDIGAFELEAGRVVVGIDIKPGTSPNPLNLKSKGVIPLAILTTGTF